MISLPTQKTNALKSPNAAEHSGMPQWRAYRNALTYYSARYCITANLLWSGLNAFIVMVYFAVQGEIRDVGLYLIIIIGCCVIIGLWEWVQKDLYPYPPEDSALSRRAYLSQARGYFDHPLPFLVWFGGTLLALFVNILGARWTLETIR